MFDYLFLLLVFYN